MITEQPVVELPTVRSAHVISVGDQGSLTVQTELSDRGSQTIGTRFQWHVNGEPLPGQTGPTLASGMVKHDDKVVVDIVPSNGNVDGTLYRTPVFIVGNATPVVLKLTFDPPAPRVGQAVTVLAEVTDADGDEVQLVYRWLQNGSLIQDGPHPSLSGDGLARGDRLSVEVVPSDGRTEGVPMRAGELVIGNGKPQITSSPSFAVVGGSLQYSVTAVDPEQDPLTFRLAAAPPDMTIDKASGQLVWTPTTNAKGLQRVRVEVLDDHDGITSQEFDVSVPSVSESIRP